MKAEIIKVEGKYIILFEEDGKLVDAVEVDSIIAEADSWSMHSIMIENKCKLILGEYGDTISEY